MTMTYGCDHARNCEECPMALAGVMRCEGIPCERVGAIQGGARGDKTRGGSHYEDKRKDKACA